MKRSLGTWQIFGFAFVSFFGTILHFLYDFTGSKIAALISSVNESTWEHMKLLFFPMFFFAIAENFFIGKKYTSFWCVKLKGTLLGLILIPVIFYTYNGAFGKSPDWINISIFFIAAAIAYLWETRELNRENAKCRYPKFSFAVLCLIGLAFIIFTFYPPKIPLFRDPTNMLYGLQ